MNNLPTGTVTFLFSDIEGSTQRWERSPELMQPAFARQEAILRAAMQAQGGYVYKMIGDAFQVAFGTASAAVAAAVEAQRALQAEGWGEIGPVRVRMALHTGVTQERGDDYVGPLLNRVARLMSAGHGGQVLLTQATCDLVRDELPEGVSLRDLGEHRLKDLFRPEHIHQLLVPGLQADFPPLKTLSARRHNLPTQLTSFIGREKEMTEIEQSILTHRLITLTGAGGTGKTRLSLRVAVDLLDQFPEGVWFVELAPLAEPELIPQTILSTFEIGDQGGLTSLQRLTDYLREKKLLLVLDNCEHLIEACAKVVDTLLNTTHALKIMATSREALGVKGEVIWQVPSLSLPDVKHLPAIEQLSQYEAVRLFIERATLVQSHFLVTNDNAPAIAQICFRLDGIPLAIELAAARVRALSADQIAERLDDRFRLLTGGSRTVLQRQQTLRATIDWSYHLLSADEKLLLCRLAVFAGGWTLEAAEQVCSPEYIVLDGGGELDIVDLLTHLVDKSLVVMSESARNLRYHMLETTRQYAHEKLAESGEADTVRDCHLDYFLKLTEEAEPKLRSAQQLIWLNRLEAEQDNLRSALERSLGRDDAEVCLRFAGAGWWFWAMRGYFQEGSRWLKAALEKPGREQEQHSAARAKALTTLAYMAVFQGERFVSKNYAEEALAIWREVGDRWWLAFTLSRLGKILVMEGDLNGARAILEEAVTLARGADDKWALGDVLKALATALEQSGDYETARALREEGLAIYRIIGDKSCVAEALEGLGILAHSQGDYERAAILYEEGLEIFRELHYTIGLVSSLFELGCIVQGQRDSEQASMLFTESLALAQEAGDKETPAYDLAGLGGVAVARGRPEQAALLFGASESIFNALGIGIFSSFRHCLADYNRWVGATSSQLGEAAFNKARAEGAAMSTEEAIKYALKETM